MEKDVDIVAFMVAREIQLIEFYIFRVNESGDFSLFIK